MMIRYGVKNVDAKLDLLKGIDKAADGGDRKVNRQQERIMKSMVKKAAKPKKRSKW